MKNGKVKRLQNSSLLGSKTSFHKIGIDHILKMLINNRKKKTRFLFFVFCFFLFLKIGIDHTLIMSIHDDRKYKNTCLKVRKLHN